MYNGCFHILFSHFLLFCIYASDRDLNSVLLIQEEATEALVKLRLAQGQHHMVFGTRWELNSGRGIRIPHRLPLHHGPTNIINQTGFLPVSGRVHNQFIYFRKNENIYELILKRKLTSTSVFYMLDFNWIYPAKLYHPVLRVSLNPG